LTQADWELLRYRVIERDRKAVLDELERQGIQARMLIRIPCPAWLMDPSVWGTCWGDWRLDHVKEEPMTGQKADDVIDQLIALCAAHDERGMRAGRVWNTAHRAEERKYLASF
jgi:hypothetical protein